MMIAVPLIARSIPIPVVLIPILIPIPGFSKIVIPIQISIQVATESDSRVYQKLDSDFSVSKRF